MSKESERSINGIKAIFFDAGGTLIHLDDTFICELISDNLGIKPSAENFIRAQHLAMSEVARIVAATGQSTERLKRHFYSVLLPEIGVSEEMLEAAIECVLKRAQAEMLWRKADVAAASTLAQLKQRRLTLGVVSNSDGRIEMAFKQAGLGHFFDFFIDSHLVGVEKPDPAIFGFALERARVAAHEAAYVGDLYSVDVVSARSAGLLPILYDPYGLNNVADCLCIRSIGELLALIA